MVPIHVDRPVGAIGAYWSVVHIASAGEMDVLEMLAGLANEALERILGTDATGCPELESAIG